LRGGGGGGGGGGGSCFFWGGSDIVDGKQLITLLLLVLLCSTVTAEFVVATVSSSSLLLLFLLFSFSRPSSHVRPPFALFMKEKEKARKTRYSMLALCLLLPSTDVLQSILQLSNTRRKSKQLS